MGGFCRRFPLVFLLIVNFLLRSVCFIFPLFSSLAPFTTLALRMCVCCCMRAVAAVIFSCAPLFRSLPFAFHMMRSFCRSFLYRSHIQYDGCHLFSYTLNSICLFSSSSLHRLRRSLPSVFLLLVASFVFVLFTFSCDAFGITICRM